MRIYNRESTEEQLRELFTQPVGTIVHVDDYETVMNRIEEVRPSGSNFELYPINPGTDLFTTYGPNHCIVTKNS